MLPQLAGLVVSIVYRLCAPLSGRVLRRSAIRGGLHAWSRMSMATAPDFGPLRAFREAEGLGESASRRSRAATSRPSQAFPRARMAPDERLPDRCRRILRRAVLVLLARLLCAHYAAVVVLCRLTEPPDGFLRHHGAPFKDMYNGHVSASTFDVAPEV